MRAGSRAARWRVAAVGRPAGVHRPRATRRATGARPPAGMGTGAVVAGAGAAAERDPGARPGVLNVRAPRVPVPEGRTPEECTPEECTPEGGPPIRTSLAAMRPVACGISDRLAEFHGRGVPAKSRRSPAGRASRCRRAPSVPALLRADPARRSGTATVRRAHTPRRARHQRTPPIGAEATQPRSATPPSPDRSPNAIAPAQLHRAAPVGDFSVAQLARTLKTTTAHRPSGTPEDRHPAPPRRVLPGPAEEELSARLRGRGEVDAGQDGGLAGVTASMVTSDWKLLGSATDCLVPRVPPMLWGVRRRLVHSHLGRLLRRPDVPWSLAPEESPSSTGMTA